MGSLEFGMQVLMSSFVMVTSSLATALLWPWNDNRNNVMDLVGSLVSCDVVLDLGSHMR
jgi:hypothetical protein